MREEYRFVQVRGELELEPALVRYSVESLPERVMLLGRSGSFAASCVIEWGPRIEPPDRFQIPHFDGETYDPDVDYVRLGTLLFAVRELMRDGCWRTLKEIQQEIERGSEASISARLRDLRKPKFGAYDIERRRRGNEEQGLFEYRLREKPDAV